MKRITQILFIAIVILFSIGQFILSDSAPIRPFLKQFNQSVTISHNRVASIAELSEIENLASKYQIDLIKEEYSVRSNGESRSKLNIYLFLSSGAWFQKSFPNIKIRTSSKNSMNQFESTISHDLLTRQEITILPFNKIENSLLTGDFHLHGTIHNVESFLDELKSKGYHTSSYSDYSVTGDFSAADLFLIDPLIVLLVIAYSFCLVVYFSNIKRELTIRLLFGYSISDILWENVTSFFRLPSIAAFLSSASLLALLSHVKTIWGFLFVTRRVFTLVCVLMCILVSIFLFINILILNKVHLISYLKGKKDYFPQLIKLVKLLGVSFTLISLFQAVISSLSYKDVSIVLPKWEKGKEYVNFGVTWPWEYTTDSDKFSEIVAPKLSNLWDQLDQDGAILYYSPVLPMEGDQVELAEGDRLLSDNYAYTNKNFITTNQILDAGGHPLKNLELEHDEWLILNPTNKMISEEDKKRIHEMHQFETGGLSEELIEKYLSIMPQQEVFTFDTSSKIDQPTMKDTTFIVVDGKNLIPDHTIKIQSLVNGRFHPKISVGRNSYQELMEKIRQTNTEPYILFLESNYTAIQAKVNRFRQDVFISYFALILSIVILIMIYHIDINIYLTQNAEILRVKNLLGYRMEDRYSERLKNSLYLNLLAFLLAITVFALLIHFNLIFIRDTNYVKLYTILLTFSALALFIMKWIEMRSLSVRERSLLNS